MLASGSTSPLPARQHPVPLPPRLHKPCASLLCKQTLSYQSAMSPFEYILSDCLWRVDLLCLLSQLPSCIRTWHHRTAEWVPLQSLGDGNLCTNRKRSLISPAAILYMKQHGRQKVAFIKASTLSVQLYLGILQESWLFPDKRHLSRGYCGSAE